MNTLLTIRNLTDEQWAQIEADYLAGNLSKEEYEQIKAIREMPEEWTTTENLLGGLGYSFASGAWEGVQWYVGNKLNGFNIPGKQAASIATRVGVDTVFNAFDTPFRSLIDSIASGDSFEESFNERGGWNSVLTDIGIGLIGSGGGEVFDAISNIRNINNKVNNLTDVLKTGDSSNSEMIDFMDQTFKKLLSEDSEYADDLINILIELKKQNPEVSFKISDTGSSYWDLNNKTLCLGDNYIKWGDSGTFSHETGHLLFDLILDNKLPDNWDDIAAKARVYSSNTGNANLKDFLADLHSHEQANYNKAINSVENEIKSLGYKSTQDYIDQMSSLIEKNLEDIKSGIGSYALIAGGMDSNLVKYIQDSINDNISPKDIMTNYVNSQIKTVKESFDRLTNGGTDCAISDIICSIYEGTYNDLNGNYLDYTYCHPSSYYTSETYAFHEVIANYTQLKLSGNTEALNQIREIFGDEFYNTLENTFDQLISPMALYQVSGGSSKFNSRLKGLESLKDFDDSYIDNIQGIIESLASRKKINIQDIQNMSDSSLTKFVNEIIEERNHQIDVVTDYLYGERSGKISNQVRLKIEKSVDAINKTGLLDNMDIVKASNIRNELTKKYFDGKFDLDNMSSSDITKNIKDYITQRIDLINQIKESLEKNYNIKVNKNIQEIDNAFSKIAKSDVLDGLDNKIAKNYTVYLIQNHLSGSIDLLKMTDAQLKNYSINMRKLNLTLTDPLLMEKVQNILKDLDDKFSKSYNRNGTYGTDQGIFKTLKSTDSKYYNDLVDYFSNKYNMTKQTTVQIMNLLDSIGACTYSDACNIILSKLIYDPEKFKELFGFSLYDKTYGYLNSEKLLFDMYIYANSVQNGGKLFDVDKNGNLKIIDKMTGGQFTTQEYMTFGDYIDKYIKTKSNTASCTQQIYFLNIYNENAIKNIIVDSINQGQYPSISTFGPMDYYLIETGLPYHINGGHIVKVIGLENDKVIVDSWGKKHYIKLSDLAGNIDCQVYVRDFTY